MVFAGRRKERDNGYTEIGEVFGLCSTRLSYLTDKQIKRDYP